VQPNCAAPVRVSLEEEEAVLYITPKTAEAQEKHSNKIGLIYELNAKHKFRKANHSETVRGVTLAETLIGQKLAAVENIKALDAHTQCTVWVNGDPIEGVHFMVPLTKEGEIAVREGAFNPSAPSLSHCASPEQNYAGVYVGAYAGATREVRKNIMQGAAEIRFLCFGA